MMRRICGFLVVCVPLSLSAQQASPAAPTLATSTALRVAVPDGTDIAVALAQDLSSQTAQMGDRVKAIIDENVVVENRVVIAKGTPVKAEVSEVKKAGRLGRGGKLALRVLGTTTVDGQSIPMRSTKGGAGGDNYGSTIALTVLFGGFGLLRHGNDMEYKSGARFQVYTDAPVTVVAP